MSGANWDRASCGLDFGTSNSTLGRMSGEGEPVLVPLEGDQNPMPSALFFNFEDDRVYFGSSAIGEYVSGAEGRMMRSLKSVLGTTLMKEETRIKAESIAFTRILELFLTQMRKRAQRHSSLSLAQLNLAETNLAEITPDRVVAGRPVRFVDDDDEADSLAQNQLHAAIAGVGFGHVEFQFEPIAAALDYERRISKEELALVVDIGGGTSDFTIIRISPERAKHWDRSADILATGGVHVGGTDFDRLLSTASIMPELGLRSGVLGGGLNLPVGPYFDLSTWHRINRLYTREMERELRSTRQVAQFPKRVDKLIALVKGRHGHLLASHAENAKIDLTARIETKVVFVQPGVELDIEVSREEFESAVAETLLRIPRALSELLRKAKLRPQDIQTLIMTGGSTQIPLLRAQLDGAFGGAKFVQTDAFGSVGLGLALDASRRF